MGTICPTTALAQAVSFDEDSMHVELTNGRTISVPLPWFPRLHAAQPEQRRQKVAHVGVEAAVLPRPFGHPAEGFAVQVEEQSHREIGFLGQVEHKAFGTDDAFGFGFVEQAAVG